MKARAHWRATLGVVAALSILAGAHVAAQYAGWKIPDGAQSEKSPLASNAAALERGRSLFASNCARCHGPAGKGDGPDSDEAADLTDDLRTDVNPEGVLFYKVWNGHIVSLRNARFDMPAFEGKLGRDDVWAVVEFLKVLRTRKAE